MKIGSTTGERAQNYYPVTDESARTLVAHWKGLRQTVHFDAGEGEVEKDTVKCYIGETYIGFPTPVRDNCVFRGWFDETGKRYKNYMKPVTDDEQLWLFAKWQENAAALSISGFTLASRATVPAARDAQTAAIACTLECYTVAGGF